MAHYFPLIGGELTATAGLPPLHPLVFQPPPPPPPPPPPRTATSRRTSSFDGSTGPFDRMLPATTQHHVSARTTCIARHNSMQQTRRRGTWQAPSVQVLVYAADVSLVCMFQNICSPRCMSGLAARQPCHLTARMQREARCAMLQACSPIMSMRYCMHNLMLALCWPCRNAAGVWRRMKQCSGWRQSWHCTCHALRWSRR